MLSRLVMFLLLLAQLPPMQAAPCGDGATATIYEASSRPLLSGRRPAGALVQGPGVIAGKRVASIASIADSRAP